MCWRLLVTLHTDTLGYQANMVWSGKENNLYIPASIVITDKAYDIVMPSMLDIFFNILTIYVLYLWKTPIKKNIVLWAHGDFENSKTRLCRLWHCLWKGYLWNSVLHLWRKNNYFNCMHLCCLLEACKYNGTYSWVFSKDTVKY